jgi:tRNA pseudouridine32 synthase/23S rRNA pseudouridine746 synthase
MTSINFSVIAETDDFIVINKSANVNFHDEEIIGSGLFNQVKAQLQLAELYPVHRLDKMTSGIVLMAKNLTTAQHIQQAFAERTMEKYYLALTDLKPKKKQGLIKGDMAKSRRGAWKLLHSMENPAITQFFSYSVAEKLRLFIIKPHTGKTHQIRVALASIGAPILGDPIYSKSNTTDRGYLHAFNLRFNLQGQTYNFIAPLEQGKLFLHQDVQQAVQQRSPVSDLPWPKLK